MLKWLKCFEKRAIILDEVRELELEYFGYSGYGEHISYKLENGALTYRNIMTPAAYGGKKYPEGYFDSKTVFLDERKRGLCRKILNEHLKELPFEEELDTLPPGAYHKAVLRLLLKDGTERCYSNTHVSPKGFSLKCKPVKKSFLNIYEFFVCFCVFPEMEFGIPIPEEEKPVLPTEKDPAFFAETLWMCSNCRTLNRFCDNRCTNCGRLRDVAETEESKDTQTSKLDEVTDVIENPVPEQTVEEKEWAEDVFLFAEPWERFAQDPPFRLNGGSEPRRSLLPNAYREEGMPYRLEFRLACQKEWFEKQSLTEYEAYEQRRVKNAKYLDKIRGSLFGGAAGDALGYPVEFASLDTIRSVYGPKGIESYRLNPLKKMALISDDTQMTLFTASGILAGHTRGCMRGIEGDPSGYVYKAYLDWLATQKQEPSADYTVFMSGLVDVPELWDRRAPGNTCLRALASGECGSVDKPINNSKGCGGVMRVAPLGLDISKAPIEYMDRQGAEIAAITHGHSLGYMPAAMLVHIVRRAVYGGCVYGNTLRDIVREAIETIEKMFSQDEHLPVLVDIMENAVKLATNGDSDEENIRRLGQGWVAEEALAIAVYCSLRYENDFSAGIIAAVNHDGDSDSTGAIAGNILGACLGFEAIEDKWKHDLELSDLILEIADDLCFGCPMEEYGTLEDPVWDVKYRRIGTKLAFDGFEEA